MKKLVINKNLSKLITVLLLLLTINFSFPLPIFSLDSTDLNTGNDEQAVTTTDAPNFTNPVCLLVGLNSSELSYREISALSGFELFSVPYRADLKPIISQMKVSQVIIKHPSGFVGLYSTDWQLVRGIETVNGADPTISQQVVLPSILQPTAGHAGYFQTVAYPGTETGTVPHGGLGYTPSPKGRDVKRHLLKLASLIGLVPFGYPGYFKNYGTQKQLFPVILTQQVPLAIGAGATYADSKLDAAEYDQARPQPRDYMFQPVIEGY